MSNLLFNIRFGTRHFQLTRDYEIYFRVNPYWIENKPSKWLEVYCIFGKNL